MTIPKNLLENTRHRALHEAADAFIGSSGGTNGQFAQLSGGLWVPHTLVHADLSGVTANQHHNETHAIGGADHSGFPSDATKYLDGTGAFSTPAGGGGGGGGGGGFTQSYVGYNTAGASSEVMTQYRQYLKKITLPNDCLVASIDIYMAYNASGQALNVMVGVLDDNAGTPRYLRAMGAPGSGSYLNLDGGSGAARWVSFPVGAWLTAGDYWISWMNQTPSSAVPKHYYDSGADKYTGNTSATMADNSLWSLSSTSNKYSVRANVFAAGGGNLDQGEINRLTKTIISATYGDHFNAGTLDAKWSYYTGSGADVTTLGGWVKLPANTTIIQAVPAGNWTIECEVMPGGSDSAIYQDSGLIVTSGSAQGSSSDMRYAAGMNNSLTQFRFVWEKFVNGGFSSSYTSNFNAFTSGVPLVSPVYLQLKWDGTNFTARWSYDRFTWYAQDSVKAPGFTPGYFGLTSAAGNGAYFNYFDKVA